MDTGDVALDGIADDISSSRMDAAGDFWAWKASRKSSGHLPLPRRIWETFPRSGMGIGGDDESGGDASAACFSLLAAFALLLPSSFSSTTRVRSTIAVSLGLRSLNAGLVESPLRRRTISSTTSFASDALSDGFSLGMKDDASVVIVLSVPNRLVWSLFRRLRRTSKRLDMTVVSDI